MVDGNGFRIASVVYNKVHSIELHQTLLGTKPHVPIGGLRNGVHGILWKPFTGPPHFVRVLSERAYPFSSWD